MKNEKLEKKNAVSPSTATICSASLSHKPPDSEKTMKNSIRKIEENSFEIIFEKPVKITHPDFFLLGANQRVVVCFDGQDKHITGLSGNPYAIVKILKEIACSEEILEFQDFADY